MGNRAGFWIRLLAALLDLLPLLLIAFGAALITAFAWDRLSTSQAADRLGQAVLLGGFLLYTSAEFWMAGTPGKWLLGLRIATSDGSPADFWRLFLRWSSKQFPLLCQCLFVLSGFGVFDLLGRFMVLIIAIGCLYILNEDHLAWHDQWASTAVFRIASRIGRAGEKR